MRNGNAARVLFGSLFVISILACNLVPPPVPSVPTQPQIVPVEPQTTDVGVTTDSGCKNQYYPVAQDASWTYKSTGSPVGEYVYTEVVSNMRADGFTVTSAHVEGFTRSMEWSCTPQGLTTTTSDGGPASGITAQQFQMKLTSMKVEGISIPVQIHPGDQWTQTIIHEGQGNIAGNEVISEGTTLFNMTALGEESVAVPAGTFTAMKIKTDITLDVFLTFQGSTTPYPSKFSQVNYWVAGIGMVKTENTAEVSGSTYSEVIELQSYNIP